jgi:hypothetical protein
MPCAAHSNWDISGRVSGTAVKERTERRFARASVKVMPPVRFGGGNLTWSVALPAAGVATAVCGGSPASANENATRTTPNTEKICFRMNVLLFNAFEGTLTVAIVGDGNVLH